MTADRRASKPACYIQRIVEGRRDRLHTHTPKGGRYLRTGSEEAIIDLYRVHSYFNTIALPQLLLLLQSQDEELTVFDGLRLQILRRVSAQRHVVYPFIATHPFLIACWFMRQGSLCNRGRITSSADLILLISSVNMT